MALNFFDHDQLAKGAHEGERGAESTPSSLHTRTKQPKEEKPDSNLRIRLPQLRKLHSETALRAHTKGLNSPLAPRSPHQSRPATSRAALQEQKEKRPDAWPSDGAELSSETTSRPKSQRRRSMQSLRRLWSMSKARDREVGDHASPDAQPKSNGHGSGINSRSKADKGKATDAEPSTTRSRANTMRNKAANILQQLTSLAASKPEQPSQPPPAPVPAAPLTTRQAQFLAESLAHVTVGEWLFKDHNRPSLIPRGNPFRRHIGPPPRGSTGLPQRRWFRISPYDRKVMWSSKWDASSLDQLKTSRQVPVNLVFETPCNILFAECLPTHLIPFKRSIVIVAPERIVKVTAPDEDRHRLWLSALRYIAASTVKLNEETWAADLRARFEVLSSGDLSVPYADYPPIPSGPLPPHQQTDFAQVTQVQHPPSNFFTEKPLPPSPPRSAFSRSSSHPPPLTPPVVPRFSKHTPQQSEGTSTIPDSELGITVRPSADEPMPELPPEFRYPPPDQHRESHDNDPEREHKHEHETEALASGALPSESGHGTEPAAETETEHRDRSGSGNGNGNGNRDSRRLTSDEFALDQMEMLVDTLGAI